MIRLVTADDVPWGLSLAHRRYKEPFDPGGALVMIGNAIRLPTALAIRSDNGFLIANILSSLWYPTHRALHVLALCVEEGHHWDAVGLLRASVKWAKEQGCDKWWLTSETDHEVGALAKRVGAEAVPHYMVALKEQEP